MNRFVLALVLCGLVTSAVPAAAQDTPMPSNTYNDPAMSFTAPAGYKGSTRPYDPDNIAQAAVVATFVKNSGKPDMRVIQIQMEQFQGSLPGFTVLSENELRGQLDGVFVTKKQQSALSNGMPAMWEEITVGDGFQEMKRWEYLWVDGFRGVDLSITGRYGELTEAQAKQDLASASGVRFPLNRY
ncbi:MAG TPA: hypothetical protein VFN37_12085 [Candidatus Baltobacteraceae bacterium]|nr:hypothetical protein [Candidatus Baltobacteraceae bacterium]